MSLAFSPIEPQVRALSVSLAESAARLTPLPIEMRPADIADAASIAAIYNASLRTRPYQPDDTAEAVAPHWLASELARTREMTEPPSPHYLGPMSLPMARMQVVAHLHHRRHLLVAVHDREIVGWLGSLGLHDRPGLSSLFELAYYVAPRWRGRGVGAQMVRHVIGQAPGWGVDRLLAMVWSDNGPSLTVLRHAGFASWGVLPGAITAFGKRRDMLMLGLVLPAAVS
ncbi:GNAT family N-acetyltransferase [Mitsuaria sp. GD03876]|uniref:GNAT family N-acetyltransferase n=1 Tax=Mitsuaria sp. GD03876 TaxID=2975399 RepID=UPI00244AFDE1|nr:GNAT family N-acetyltransferase [Mitsuaria sp. GD03876]MDH0866043.1 GNAT family N-acetyltransferase [Mitsuaria sp. GD03876]